MEDQTFITIISIVGISICLLIIMAVTLIAFFHHTKKKIVEKEQEKAALKIEHQRKILQTSIAIQEQERNRIAQDLHDAISAKLNVVSLTTHVLLIDKTINEKQKTALEQILDITTNTLESARKIAHDLMPPILDKFGLKAALEELFEEFTANTSIDIEHNVEELAKLSKTNQLHLFRIIQELINNSIRHGKANELVIYMEQAPTGFMLHYQDNGVGFNVKEIKKKPGIGIQNVKSRVKILNGNLTIESTPNSGSKFIIRCRYQEKSIIKN